MQTESGTQGSDARQKLAAGDHAAPERDEGYRRRRTRDQLIAGSLAVFAERGVQGATVQQLAAAAGFTRGAFYSSFDTKEELFLAMLESARSGLIERLDSAIHEAFKDADRSDVATALEAIVFAIFSERGVDRQQLLVQLEWTQMALRDPDLAARQLELQHRTEDNLARVVQLAIDRLGRRFLVDVRLATIAVEGIFENALRVLLLEGSTPQDLPQRVAGPITTLILAVTEPLA